MEPWETSGEQLQTPEFNSQELGLTTEEERIYKLFIETFKYVDEDDRQLANAIIKYILSQLNQASLRGYLYFYDYQQAIIKANKGLFRLVYLEYFTEDLNKRDILFNAACNFLIMLYSRVYEGKDYAVILKEVESRSTAWVRK